MTTEVVVMNREAVALAADSAVTINSISENGFKTKIYNSANKLYKLSPFHSIGILIYNGANYMDIPWETIIKLYRIELNENKFSTLEEYAQDFFKFLTQHSTNIIPKEHEKNTIIKNIRGYFIGVILSNIITALEEETRQGTLDLKRKKTIVKNIIKEHYLKWEGFKCHPAMPDDFRATINHNYTTEINSTVVELQNFIKDFLGIDISPTLGAYLQEIAVNLFFKQGTPIPSYSGVVFAGFGEKDIFPKCLSYEVEIFLCSQLKYNSMKEYKIDFENQSEIIPFAQQDEVQTFVEGIHPVIKNIINSLLRELLINDYAEMLTSILNLESNSKAALKKTLIKTGTKKFDELWGKLEQYTHKRYINDIMEVIAILPKEELAATAEALVNITSIKRKISMELETVGGPVDVAVISKKDGFIWIKRKHYFKPEYNYEFFNKIHISKGKFND